MDTTSPSSSIISGGNFGKMNSKKRKTIAIVIVGVIIVAALGVAAAMMLTGNRNTGGTEETSQTASLPLVDVALGSTGPTPASVTIKKGQQVTFTNQDTAPHQLTAEQTLLPGYDSGQVLNTGDSYTFTFETIGTFHYYDPQNAKFTGTVIVE